MYALKSKFDIVCRYVYTIQFKPTFYLISEKDTESWKDENFQTVKQTKKKVIKINMDMDPVPMYQMYGIILEVSY